jgi:ribosomal protein S4E
LNSYEIQARIIKAEDTIKLGLENNNIIDSIKCDAGNVVKEAG